MSRNPEFELFIASLEELDRLLASLAYYSGGTWSSFRRWFRSARLFERGSGKQALDCLGEVRSGRTALELPRYVWFREMGLGRFFVGSSVRFVFEFGSKRTLVVLSEVVLVGSSSRGWLGKAWGVVLHDLATAPNHTRPQTHH